jgi:hypothetical protein
MLMIDVVEEVAAEDKLAATDRCDSCGAQAYVLALGVSGELMFCGHHYKKIQASDAGKEALSKFAFEVVDERHRINAKSS